MLKLEDIRFPITFFTAVGPLVFKNAAAGYWDGCELSRTSMPLNHLISAVNDGLHSYTMAQAAPVAPPPGPQPLKYRLIQRGEVFKVCDTLTEALQVAEGRAKRTDIAVTIVNDFATVKPKTTITAEVIYA